MRWVDLAWGGFSAGLLVGLLWLLAHQMPVDSIGDGPAGYTAPVAVTNPAESALEPTVVPMTLPPPAATTPEPASSWVRLGKEVEFHGMEPANQHHDGVTQPEVAGDLDCHSLQRYPGRPELYAYFRIDPAFKRDGTNAVVVEVEYFDADPGGHFRLDYDSHDESNRSLGAYTQSKERVNLKGTERWRKARFLIDDARFAGRENDGSDFRVTVVGGRFFLRSIKVVWE